MEDRECVAYTDNVLAICDKTECKIPCKTDVECDQPYDYDFKSCIDGACVDIGCESDRECRIRLLPQVPSAVASGTAVCRDIQPKP